MIFEQQILNVLISTSIIGFVLMLVYVEWLVRRHRSRNAIVIFFLVMQLLNAVLCISAAEYFTGLPLTQYIIHKIF